VNAPWDIARLNLMISSKIEENASLEYKAAGAFNDTDKKKRDVRTEITKDVSAMANSSGGIIIYGMAECKDDAKRHLPERIDPITRSQFSKEWLEHVISNIEPRIASLLIIPIEIPTNPDHVVYIVQIPKSTTAHQALDLKYYRRYNFEAVAMSDSEIRDVMNRQQFPTLSVSAALAFYGKGGALHFEIHNTGDVLARYFAAIIHTPVKWKGRKFVFDDNPVVVELEDGQSYRPKFTNALGAPLFPKSSIYHNFKFSFAAFPEPKATIRDIRYKVYADAMPFIEGKFDPEQIVEKPKP
jgi:Putative DNA-binding domain